MIKSFLKLIRWPNLIIIIATMAFLQWFIITPGLSLPQEYSGLSLIEFILLAGALIFTVIGGYIINDIKDVTTDMINKPGKNAVGRVFTLKQSYYLYFFFSIAGVVLGTIVSIMVHRFNFSLIFLMMAGLLWFYATDYQCMVLTGNIVVSFLSTLPLGLVLLYEMFALKSGNTQVIIQVQAIHSVLIIVGIYVIFAFLVSLLREVIKDIEDVEGDERTNCRTLAVAYGEQKAKVVALIIAFIGLVAAFASQWLFFKEGFYLLVYYFSVIDILFGWIIVKLLKANEKVHFNKLSTLSKLLMFVGIVSMVLFYFEF